MHRDTQIGIGFLAILAAAGAGVMMMYKPAAAADSGQIPHFEVDPLWPKPLPNHWRIGSTIGVAVDAQDHVWIVHRPDSLQAKEQYAAQNPPAAVCCTAAPPVLEFDQEGNLIASWGGPGNGYEWPQSNHGITVDYKGNVWIGGNGASDGQVLKFTQSGKLLLQIGGSKPAAGPAVAANQTGETSPAKGGPPQNAAQPRTATGGGRGGANPSNDVTRLGRAAKIFVDPDAQEAYIADGYGNKRVIVFDSETGAYKRHWGAYGNVPDDQDLGPYKPGAPPAQQFRNPVHCAELAHDGLLYVCDRANDRIQVFHKDGKFVKEAFLAPNTLGDGAVFDIAFSKDPEQKFLFVADGANDRIHVLLRDTLQEVTNFGDGGRQPGQFYAVHSIAADSKGNLYTTETYEGKRLQKFVYKGLAQGLKPEQGTVWPQK